MSTITDLTNATSALVAANASLANEIAALSTALANRSGLSASDQAALDGAVAQLDAAASDITNQVQALTALQNS